MRQGRRALARGDLADAIAHLRDAATAEPEDPERWRELAEALTRAERWSDAREAWLRLRELPGAEPDGGAEIEIGMTWERERDYDEALRWYREAAARAPDEARVHRVLGGRLLRWGEEREALPALERALELEPEHPEAWKALAVARYRNGLHAEALVAYEEALTRFPLDRGLQLGRAAVLVNLGRHDEALAAYDALAARYPAFAPIQVGRGILLDVLGRPEEAEAAFERAVRLSGGEARFRQRLSDYRALLAERANEAGSTP